MIKVGAHVSAAGALDKCVERAQEIGAETIQLFASPPQSWRHPAHSDEACAALRQRAAVAGIGPLFVHGVYLINLAAADPVHLARSIDSLKRTLDFCAHAGARGVIFHLGSHKGAGFDAVLPQIVDALRQVLASCPNGPELILENSAGAGDSIGSHLAELGAIVRAVAHTRVTVCLDTCHAFAAGYDVTTAGGVEAMMAEFDREIGLNRLVAVHANDSKAGLGSGRDRHENIGRGYIGEQGFRAILAHPAFDGLPFILEVPGFAGNGPDRQNVETLRRIAAAVG